jgi:hypothetical protein
MCAAAIDQMFLSVTKSRHGTACMLSIAAAAVYIVALNNSHSIHIHSVSMREEQRVEVSVVSTTAEDVQGVHD